MRRFLATILSALLTGLPAMAQSAGQQPSEQQPNAPAASQRETIYDASQQTTAQQATQPQDSNQPVLRRRSPEDGKGTNVESAPSATDQAPAPSQDPDEPVLKRRPSADSTDGSQSQQSNAPVLQTRQPPPTTIPMAQTVPAMTEFHAQLDRTLSTKSSRAGDSFTVTLVDPLRNQQGTTLIPAGAKINGVVQNSESGKIFASMRGKGKIELRFQTIQLANGQTLPLQATLLGIIEKKGVNARTNDEGQVTGGGPGGKTTAKDVGIGAGVGTLAGLIMGSALKGMAIGAIAGGGYVLANAGKDVEIPAETTLNLRLDQLLTVPR